MFGYKTFNHSSKLLLITPLSNINILFLFLFSNRFIIDYYFPAFISSSLLFLLLYFRISSSFQSLIYHLLSLLLFLLLNEFLLLLHFKFLLLPLSVWLRHHFPFDDFRKLFQSKELGFTHTCCSFYILFSLRFILPQFSQHPSHIIYGYYLTIAWNWFEEDFDELLILHVVLLLDDLLVIKDLFGSEGIFKSFTTPIINILTDTFQEGVKLVCFFRETKGFEAINYFSYLQSNVLVLNSFIVIEFHWFKSGYISLIFEILKCLTKLFSSTVTSILTHSRLKLLWELLEVTRIVIQRHFKLSYNN